MMAREIKCETDGRNKNLELQNHKLTILIPLEAYSDSILVQSRNKKTLGCVDTSNGLLVSSSDCSVLLLCSV